MNKLDPRYLKKSNLLIANHIFQKAKLSFLFENNEPLKNIVPLSHTNREVTFLSNEDMYIVYKNNVLAIMYSLTALRDIKTGATKYATGKYDAEKILDYYLDKEGFDIDIHCSDVVFKSCKLSAKEKYSLTFINKEKSTFSVQKQGINYIIFNNSDYKER